MIATIASRCLIQVVDITVASGSTTGGGTYAENDPVTLTATAKSGFVFVNWTVNGTEVSTNSTYNFNAPSGNTTYTANFAVQVSEIATTGNFGFNINYTSSTETIEINEYQGIINTSGNLGFNINYNLDSVFEALSYQGVLKTIGNLGFVIEHILDMGQATIYYPRIINRIKHVDPVPGYMQIFDKNKMFNSIDYSPNRRNAFGSFKFTTDATTIYIKVSNNFTAFQNLDLFINETFNQAIVVTSNIQYKSLTLPVGNKTVEIVEGITTHDGGGQILTGTDILELYVPNNSTTTILEEGAVAKKIVFLTDSIGVGAGVTNPIRESFTRLFKSTHGIESATIGAGWDSLKNHAAGTPELISTTVSRINYLFRNTLDKRLVVTLSHNDVWVANETPGNINIMMNNLLDVIHASDPAIKIYLVGPFTRLGSETQFATIRTNFNIICTERSGYCTYMNGPTLSPNYPLNYPDSVHPNTVESAIIEGNMYPYLSS